MLYPRVDELVLNDDDLKELCVFPALVEYFNRFPLRRYEQITIPDQETFIDFPDSEVFGVMDCRITEKNYLNRSSAGGTDFLSLALYQRTRNGMKSIPRYGQFSKSRRLSNFNPEGLKYQYLNDRQLYNSLTELETSRIIIDEDNRQIRAFSTVPAKLAVTWASYSRDFDTVKQTQKLRVCKLASAYALEYMASMGSIMEDNSQEKQFNIGELKAKSEELRTEVMEFWNSLPNVQLMRGS